MQVTLNTAIIRGQAQPNRANQGIQRTNPAAYTAPAQQMAFTGFLENARYYFAQKLDSKREAKKNEQFAQVRQTINDDIKFMAERQGIPLEAARQRYEDTIEALSIPLKYNGDEDGLNKVVGYSMEKYKALKEVVLPLMAAGTAMEKSHPTPNGVLFYGPGYTGKTHFAQALGEHLELKDLAGFKQYRPSNKEFKDDDSVPLLTAFDDAEKRYKETGKRQILFFDDVDRILDEENPNLKGVWLAKTRDCAKNGVTWVGVCNVPSMLPDLVFKPSRLNVDILLNKTSGGEKSAVMSYFWTKYNRLDESNHPEILDKHNISGFHFYPPEVKQVAGAIDRDLLQNHDRKSRLDHRITVRKPVKTEMVNAQIEKYLGSDGVDKKSMNAVLTADAAEYQSYVQRKRGQHEGDK